MKTDFDVKLNILRKVIDNNEPIRIMIIGLGSVGTYLLDYLVNMSDPQIEIIVVGRNYDKMISDVNIVKVASIIRGSLQSNIIIESDCDLNNVDSIESVITKYNPNIIVNSSRVYSGLKYGSISWNMLRAYGIWTPLSIKYAKNIMIAYKNAKSNAITINTSYSDAVIPWLKSAGLSYYDFGSGNLNHLIPRMKLYFSNKFKISNLNDIKITLALSHFHDVVISKEGHSEGQALLINAKYNSSDLNFNQDELLNACKIPMPVDQKRNMMNASSNFDIIKSIIKSIRDRDSLKIHSPGVRGLIGGYPFILDCAKSEVEGHIDESVFTLNDMILSNRESIYKDGVENVSDGYLTYTDELIYKVRKTFSFELPKNVYIEDSDKVADLLIKKIIEI